MILKNFELILVYVKKTKSEDIFIKFSRKSREGV